MFVGTAGVTSVSSGLACLLIVILYVFLSPLPLVTSTFCTWLSLVILNVPSPETVEVVATLVPVILILSV